MQIGFFPDLWWSRTRKRECDGRDERKRWDETEETEVEMQEHLKRELKPGGAERFSDIQQFQDADKLKPQENNWNRPNSMLQKLIFSIFVKIIQFSQLDFLET